IINITTECIEVYFTSGWKQIMCDCFSAPPQPGLITGPGFFCKSQQGVQYSISPVAGSSSYTWAVPSGATIISGQGSTNITVNFGTNGGTVSVLASNSCGASTPSTITVSPSIPDATF